MAYTRLSEVRPGMYKEIDTDAGMTEVLTSENVGKFYKFTGTTGTYTNGDIYVVKEASGVYSFDAKPVGSLISGENFGFRHYGEERLLI